ncbi:MAG: hypothetical protein CYPHOPRED_004642 [Cyphobasidiales sp. Tagirdzhanova-0007]|nr:MAG: hypothetical protein CYPHOPRED_004642 [Cyphobasidiales sp. Tagirdzhanova-0007]
MHAWIHASIERGSIQHASIMHGSMLPSMLPSIQLPSSWASFTHAPSMPRLPLPSTVEHSFLLNALSQHSLRIDGRSLLQPRQLALSFGSVYGSVEVSLGGSIGSMGSTGTTRVFVQVSAEVVKPREDRPFEGFVLVQSEISPLAGSNYEGPSEEEVLISRALEKSIRRSEVVDREALCIIAGQKVWQIRLDVHPANDEGNLLDCASVACMAALLHFRKPDVTVEGTEVTVHSLEERVPVPLSLLHSPYCITFALFGPIAVLDPSLLEAQLCTGTLTLTLNAQNEICVLTKAGGEPLSVHEILRIVGIAKARVAEIDAAVKGALKKNNALQLELGY